MKKNPQETADEVTVAGDILNAKLDFLCSEIYWEENVKY